LNKKTDKKEWNNAYNWIYVNEKNLNKNNDKTLFIDYCLRDKYNFNWYDKNRNVIDPFIVDINETEDDYKLITSPNETNIKLF